MLPSERATTVVKRKQKTRGHPGPIYVMASEMWSTIIGTKVTPEQTVYCMVALKMARELEGVSNSDNDTDIAGFANVHELVIEWLRDHGS